MTYSVVKRYHTEDDERAARLVRERIGEIDYNDWYKLQNVETALAGTLAVVGDSAQSKRKHVEKVVTELFKTTFAGIKSIDRPDIHVAIFVETLERVIEFSIKGS
ncbi:hypothetical protein ACLUS7_22615 [Enterobacterales bacterium BD_CKDN230030183-1A_HGKHYDSX7]